jgi:hypothetical protein
MTSRRDASEPTCVTQQKAGRLLTWVARSTVGGAKAGPPLLDGMAHQDWAEFLRLGLAHGMLPLAWRALESSAESLPAPLVADLRDFWAANARRNLSLAAELRSILARLENAGVRALPWKGLLLAQRAYGDLSLRQFFDLDVLVRRVDLPAARAALAELGFLPEKKMTDAQRETYVDHQGELELVREADGLWLELHTAVVPTYYAAGRSSDDLWQQVVRADVARFEVWALHPVDDIEALCVHGSKHRWDRLAWIIDVALTARLLDDDAWQRLTSAARDHGTLRIVAMGLILAQDVCGAALPGDVMDKVRSDRTALGLAGRVGRALFDPRPSRFDALSFHARMRERPRDRARYLFSVAFTPSGADWESLSLPRRLFPVYALTRPVRLAWKYGRRALRRAPRDQGRRASQ